MRIRSQNVMLGDWFAELTLEGNTLRGSFQNSFARGPLVLVREAPPAAPPPAPPAAPPAVDPEVERTRRICGALVDLFRKEVEEGRVSPERARAMEPIIADMVALYQEPPSDPLAIVAWKRRGATLLDRAKELSLNRPPEADPVLARALGLVHSLKGYLAQELGRAHKAPSEREAGRDLFKRAGHAEVAFRELARDGRELWRYECDALRPLARDARRYAYRHHLTLGRPRWPSPPVTEEPSAVFFSGSDGLRTVLSAALAARNWNLLKAPGPHVFAQSRWDDLRRSGAALFEFSGGDARDMAQIAYELGMALALGKPVVVARSGGFRLPFDVDVAALSLDGGDAGKACAEGLESAVYGFQRGGEGSSVAASLEAAWRGLKKESARLLLCGAEAEDALQAQAILHEALGLEGQGAPELLLPS